MGIKREEWESPTNRPTARMSECLKRNRIQ